MHHDKRKINILFIFLIIYSTVSILQTHARCIPGATGATGLNGNNGATGVGGTGGTGGTGGVGGTGGTGGVGGTGGTGGVGGTGGTGGIGGTGGVGGTGGTGGVGGTGGTGLAGGTGGTGLAGGTGGTGGVGGTGGTGGTGGVGGTGGTGGVGGTGGTGGLGGTGGTGIIGGTGATGSSFEINQSGTFNLTVATEIEASAKASSSGLWFYLVTIDMRTSMQQSIPLPPGLPGSISSDLIVCSYTAPSTYTFTNYGQFTGTPGPTGIAGATGATGANGATGLNGATGATGLGGTGGTGGVGGTGGTGGVGGTGGTGGVGGTGGIGGTGGTGGVGGTGGTGITGATGPAGPTTPSTNIIPTVNNAFSIGATGFYFSSIFGYQGIFNGSATSSSATTGAVIIPYGGLGMGKSLYVGGTGIINNNLVVNGPTFSAPSATGTLASLTLTNGLTMSGSTSPLAMGTNSITSTGTITSGVHTITSTATNLFIVSGTGATGNYVEGQVSGLPTMYLGYDTTNGVRLLNGNQGIILKQGTGATGSQQIETVNNILDNGSGTMTLANQLLINMASGSQAISATQSAAGNGIYAEFSGTYSSVAHHNYIGTDGSGFVGISPGSLVLSTGSASDAIYLTNGLSTAYGLRIATGGITTTANNILDDGSGGMSVTTLTISGGFFSASTASATLQSISIGNGLNLVNPLVVNGATGATVNYLKGQTNGLQTMLLGYDPTNGVRLENGNSGFIFSQGTGATGSQAIIFPGAVTMSSGFTANSFSTVNGAAAQGDVFDITSTGATNNLVRTSLYSGTVWRASFGWDSVNGIQIFDQNNNAAWLTQGGTAIGKVVTKNGNILDGGAGCTGCQTTTGVATFTSTTASGSTGTGAIVVAGGVGVAGSVNVGSTLILPATSGTTLVVDSTAASGSTGTGAIIVAGGVGVAGSVNVGGTLTLPTTSGTTLVVDSTTVSGSTGTGAVVIAGGMGIQGNIFTGGSLHLGNNQALLIAADADYNGNTGGSYPIRLSTVTAPGKELFLGYDETNNCGVVYAINDNTVGETLVLGNVVKTGTPNSFRNTLDDGSGNLGILGAITAPGGATIGTQLVLDTNMLMKWDSTNGIQILDFFNSGDPWLHQGSTGAGRVASLNNLLDGGVACPGCMTAAGLLTAQSGFTSTSASLTQTTGTTLVVDSTAVSSSTGTGAVVIAGGLGVEGNAYIQGPIVINGATTLSWTSGAGGGYVPPYVVAASGASISVMAAQSGTIFSTAANPVAAITFTLPTTPTVGTFYRFYPGIGTNAGGSIVMTCTATNCIFGSGVGPLNGNAFTNPTTGTKKTLSCGIASSTPGDHFIWTYVTGGWVITGQSQNGGGTSTLCAFT